MKLGEIQRYHYQCEYSTPEGDYGSSIDPDGDGEWVKFTDAQAKSLADERRIAELESLMLTMADAWQHYRNCYEAAGTGDPMTGRAWMLCTRAENKMREALAALRVETK